MDKNKKEWLLIIILGALMVVIYMLPLELFFPDYGEKEEINNYLLENTSRENKVLSGNFKMWYKKDLILGGVKGDHKFKNKTGSDLKNVYAKISDGFLYILIERHNPKNEHIKDTDYKISLLLGEKSNLTTKLLIEPGASIKKLELFEIDGKNNETIKKASSVNNPRMGVEVFFEFVEVKLPLQKIGFSNQTEISNITFGPPAIELKDSIDKQEFKPTS